jgi:hypothetical protein
MPFRAGARGNPDIPLTHIHAALAYYLGRYEHIDSDLACDLLQHHRLYQSGLQARSSSFRSPRREGEGGSVLAALPVWQHSSAIPAVGLTGGAIRRALDDVVREESR